jgi:hypothetical protein
MVITLPYFPDLRVISACVSSRRGSRQTEPRRAARACASFPSAPSDRPRPPLRACLSRSPARRAPPLPAVTPPFPSTAPWGRRDLVLPILYRGPDDLDQGAEPVDGRRQDLWGLRLVDRDRSRAVLYAVDALRQRHKEENGALDLAANARQRACWGPLRVIR